MAMLNVASLLKHIDEICLLLYYKKLDILAHNETCHDSSISITESQGYVEFTISKNLKVSNFLNDLYGYLLTKILPR